MMFNASKVLQKLVLPNSGVVVATANVSTSSCMCNDRNFRRRWVTPDKWSTVDVKGRKMPWQPNLPQKRVKDQWNKDKAYFGMYDFMFALGDDVTLQPKLFCKGPAYIRGSGNRGEMMRLVRQREILGSRMFAEDLLTVNKRIMQTVKRHRKKSGF